jgi:hypothetical protein
VPSPPPPSQQLQQLLAVPAVKPELVKRVLVVTAKRFLNPDARRPARFAAGLRIREEQPLASAGCSHALPEQRPAQFDCL